MRVKVVDQPPQEVRTFEAVDLTDQLTMEDVETIREIFHTPLTGSYNWDYDSANAKIRRLYELGKRFNWNPTADIDWDAPCDMADFPSEASLSALNGYPEYEALSHEEKVAFSWKAHAQTMSQFLHGEQGALLVASQFVVASASTGHLIARIALPAILVMEVLGAVIATVAIYRAGESSKPWQRSNNGDTRRES